MSVIVMFADDSRSCGDMAIYAMIGILGHQGLIEQESRDASIAEMHS